MGADWWAIGAEWRERHGAVEHGDVVRVAAGFAAEKTLGANTIRGYKAAREFVERLQAEGLLDAAGVQILASLPLKSVAVLQRVARYGQAELEPLLRLVLTPQRPARAELEAMEAAVRGRAPPGSGRAVNAHAFRLRAGSFRDGALTAWRAMSVTRGWRVAIPDGPNQIEPFAVDALASRPAGYNGIRLVAETADTTIRPRLAEAVAPALAAARAFASFVLLTQSRADADELTARVHRVGDCGVGVGWYDPAGRLEPVLKPARSAAPDLADHYAATLARFFPNFEGGDDAM